LVFVHYYGKVLLAINEGNIARRQALKSVAKSVLFYIIDIIHTYEILIKSKLKVKRIE
jgi:hypothetical protein